MSVDRGQRKPGDGGTLRNMARDSALFARARPKVGIACDSSLCCAEAQRTRVAFGESEKSSSAA